MESEQLPEENNNAVNNHSMRPLDGEKYIPRYVSVKQLSQFFPAFSELSLRWIIFQKMSNGAHVFIKKIGKRKIVIDSFEFRKWIEVNKAV